MLLGGHGQLETLREILVHRILVFHRSKIRRQANPSIFSEITE